MNKQVISIRRIFSALVVVLSIVLLLSSISTFPYGHIVESVDSELSWMITVIPWLLVPFFIGFAVLCVTKQWKVRFLMLFLIAVTSITIFAAPGYIYDLAIREVKVKELIPIEEIERLESYYGIKCFQYTISEKGSLIVYAKEFYSEEFELEIRVIQSQGSLKR